MGVRRAGYFTSLIIMILGIIAIPLGLIFSAGGVFESIQSGSTDTLTMGILLVILGIFMFIVGMIASIVLKKSDSGQVNISINAAEGIIKTMPEPKPILKLNKDERLENKQIQTEREDKGKRLENKQIQTEREDQDSETSIQDMVAYLQEAEVGDKQRFDYITKRIKNGKTIYNSDIQYIKIQFEKFRTKTTKDANYNSD